MDVEEVKRSGLKLMEESNIQDKELILRVLSMYNDPEVREREIRNLSETFTEVSEEILPKLRRAKMTTTVDFIGKSDEELKTIMIDGKEYKIE